MPRWRQRVIRTFLEGNLHSSAGSCAWDILGGSNITMMQNTRPSQPVTGYSRKSEGTGVAISVSWPQYHWATLGISNVQFIIHQNLTDDWPTPPYRSWWVIKLIVKSKSAVLQVWSNLTQFWKESFPVFKLNFSEIVVIIVVNDSFQVAVPGSGYKCLVGDVGLLLKVLLSKAHHSQI